MARVFAGAVYQGRLEEIASDEDALKLVIVHKPEGQSTFMVLPERWDVERTFTWLVRYRRVRADYEARVVSSRA